GQPGLEQPRGEIPGSDDLSTGERGIRPTLSPVTPRSRRLLCVAASLATLLPGIVVAQRPRPRLVLVVVIDQFRPDYLTRFSRFFGKGGFNLFLRRGAGFTVAK